MRNVLLSGVGGQGTVLAAKVLAQAAQDKGWQVRTAETIGMAQRGGNVVSHVRMGDAGEEVFAPLLADWDAEIAEAHHIHKKDAPSGTALMLGKALGRDVPMHSFRLGGLPGDHEALFGNEGETLSVRHHAISRSVFAIGAVRAARFALAKEKGLFTFEDVVRG